MQNKITYNVNSKGTNMNKNTNLISIYASSIIAKQKAQLFAIYRDYIFLSRNFEQITQINSSKYLFPKIL